MTLAMTIAIMGGYGLSSDYHVMNACQTNKAGDVLLTFHFKVDGVSRLVHSEC